MACALRTLIVAVECWQANVVFTCAQTCYPAAAGGRLPLHSQTSLPPPPGLPPPGLSAQARQALQAEHRFAAHVWNRVPRLISAGRQSLEVEEVPLLAPAHMAGGQRVRGLPPSLLPDCMGLQAAVVI